MKIICLVKFVPDVQNFTYDYEKHVLIRQNKHLILNPDDAKALAVALKLKKMYQCNIEVVSMGPISLANAMKDLIRRGVDKGTLIADERFAGSDSFVTARILHRYLNGVTTDLILSGTHSLDGDTAHVPAQIAEMMDMNYMANVTSIEEGTMTDKEFICVAESEEEKVTFLVQLPALIGVCKESKYKLPFVKFENLEKAVDDQLQIISNEELGFLEKEIGLIGSKTKVVHTFVKKEEKKEQTIVQNDAAGIEYVFDFLKEKGFLSYE